MKALTPSEVTNVMAVSDPTTAAMVLLSYRHGLRASEICQLLWSDVNLEAKTITVRRLKNSLTTTQALSEAEIVALTALPKTDPRVFPTSRWSWARQFKEVCGLAGVAESKAHPHALKHACGFALVAGNVNLAVIKAHLGHRSINSTIIYSVPTEDQVSAIVSAALGAVA